MTRPLTPARADRVLLTATPPARILWTLPTIAGRLGVGIDFARALAQAPESPIRKVQGRWMAIEQDLFDYLRRGPTA